MRRCKPALIEQYDSNYSKHIATNTLGNECENMTNTYKYDI